MKLAIRTEQFDRAKLQRLAKRYGIKQMSVFGSRARGDGVKNSDLDLLVTFDKRKRIGLFEFVAIQEQMTKKIHTTVDLHTFDGMHPYLMKRIQKELVAII